ncbi:MAG TPA: phosphohydrolase [Caulobacteraceae bacterium]|jgi:predicted metal-dependent HD superfamily phosphohydrolase
MLPAALIEQIRKLHGGPERAYHAWSHPQALLGLLAEVRGQLADPLAVECAILLHDAVYDPTRADNEAKSAVLARDLLAGVVPDATLERAVSLIEATARHEVPAGMPADEAADCRVFLDMDLSILGADPEAFDGYEAGVRHEYRHVPDAAFRQGRAAVLERFLGRERLYMSGWGHQRFEAKARENLARSLRALRS